MGIETRPFDGICTRAAFWGLISARHPAHTQCAIRESAPDTSERLEPQRKYIHKLTHKKQMGDSQGALATADAAWMRTWSYARLLHRASLLLPRFFVADAGPGASPDAPHSLLEIPDARLGMVDSSLAAILLNNRQKACARSPPSVPETVARGDARTSRDDALRRSLPGEISRAFRRGCVLLCPLAWRMVSSLPYGYLEFATTTCREAGRCCLLTQGDFPTA